MKKHVLLSVRILLLVLLAVSISHAFIQSSLSQKASSAESNKVGEIVGEIIPPETKPGEYIQTNLRKLAHFTEFANIGTFAVLHAVFYLLKRKWAHILIVPLGMLIALMDETIQIFSNRGASVSDIWIDVLGYVTAIAAVYAAYLAVRLVMFLVLRAKERKALR